MSSRSRYLFVTLPELGYWLRQLLHEKNWHVVVYDKASGQLNDWDGEIQTLAFSSKAYVMSTPMEVHTIDVKNLQLGRLGWVQLDVPRTSGDILYAIQVAARSDWFDESSKEIVTDDQVIRLFEKLWKNWKPHVVFSVVGRNKITGKEAVYRNIGYSAGAAQWYKNNGRLHQVGVENVEFHLR